MNDALLSSKKMDYCTPQAFFDELNREFRFTLDAAATAKSAKCAAYYTPETDGLTSPWNPNGGGAVFCNPPYGREIGKWVRKAYEEAQRGTTSSPRKARLVGMAICCNGKGNRTGNDGIIFRKNRLRI